MSMIHPIRTAQKLAMLRNLAAKRKVRRKKRDAMAFESKRRNRK